MRYLLLKEAQEYIKKRTKRDYSLSHLRYLAKTGKLEAQKIANQWITSKDWLDQFLKIQNSKIKNQNENVKIKKKILNLKFKIQSKFKIQNSKFRKKKRFEFPILPSFFGWQARLSFVKIRQRALWPFRNHLQESLAVIFILLLAISGFLLYRSKTIFGASYTWTQTDWSGGQDQANYPLHPTNQCASPSDPDCWTKYWSKGDSADTATAGQITLTTPSPSQIPAKTETLPFQLRGHSAIFDSQNNKIYIFGGYDKTDGVFSDKIIEYDPSTGTVTTKTETLPSTREDAAAVFDSANNKIYILGGYRLDSSTNDPVYLNDIIEYDPSAGTVTTKTETLPFQLRGHSAVFDSQNNKIYIFGGYDNTNSVFSNKIIEYDPSAGTVTTKTETLPSGREYAPAVFYPQDNKIYIFGGYYLDGSNNPVYLDQIIEYDPSAGTVTTKTETLPSALKGAAATYYYQENLISKIYIFGGYDGTNSQYSDQVISYNPATGIVGTMSETLPTPRKDFAAVFDSNDTTVYLLGGYYLNGDSPTYLDQILYYQVVVVVVSSPYNTTDPTTVISKIEWTEDLPAGTDIKFQIRTAPNNDPGTPSDPSDDTPGTWSSWCGPDDGVTGSCSSNTYFTDAAGGEQIDDVFQDASNDQWVQYKVYLIRDSLTITPTLYDVTLTYVINTSPVVSNVTASQDATGTVNVSYDISDQEETSLTVSLLYDLGITLTDNPLSSTSTTVNVSDATNLPTSGTIQIDSEQITYTGKSGNSLTGCSRGANNTAFYKTSHNQGATIWIKANTVSGDVGTVTGISSATSSKSIAWTAKTDIDGFYAASTVKVKVNANDGNAARQVGYADSSTFEFDTKDPVVGTTAVGATGIDINGNQLTIVTSQDKTNNLTVTLHLAASDDTALQMQFSNDNSTYSAWQAYATSTSWDLDAYCPTYEEGCTKTVYAKFKDAYGNTIGPYSDTITLDNNPPAVPSDMFIQDVSNADTGEYRLFISWAKNTEADWIRYEIYRSTDGTNFSQLTTISLETDSSAKDHNYYMDTGLTSGQTYYYKVRSVDDIINNSDFGTTVSLTAGGNPSDTVPPTISDVATSNPTTNSVQITWTTDEISTSDVLYSLPPIESTTPSTQGVVGYVSSHSVTLVGLDSDTTYDYKVKSCDAANNCSQSATSQFITATAETTPPQITSGPTASNETESGATITWTTDEASTSFVEYSTQSGFSSGSVQGQYDLVTSHTVALTGLSANTTYYYKVHSADAAGNEKISAESSFSTSASTSDVTPPVISNVATSSIAYNTATITWTTDENSSSFVEFGQTTSYGRIYGQEDSVTSHSVELPHDLVPSTLYHFRARSKDVAGNEAMSADYTFTTAASPNDTTAPTISAVTIGTPDTTSVTITWTTNEEADSYVDFDTTTSYSQSQGSPLMTTSHSVTVVGLQPSTLYYARVRSTDPSGNQAIDNNSGSGYTFVTETSTASPPVISDVQITDVSHNSAKILWTTDKASNSFVEYGFDTSYGYSQGQFDSATSHSVALVGLLSEATYHFRVRSLDSDGLEGVSSDYTFTTESAPDITPPVVSSVTATNITLTTADITWITNENANSLVDYGTACASLTLLAGDSQTYSVSHTVSLSNLSSGTTYYYQVRSEDSAGNWTTDNNSGSCYSFETTADTTAPTISSVSAPVVDRNSATITWNTDESATSQVEYSTSSDLTGSSLTTEVTDLRTEHSVIVSSLTSETTYYYRVISKDASNNTATSSISSFTTAGAKEDTTAPVISSVSCSSQSETSLLITWTTDENSTSLVDYGEATSLGSLAGQPADSVTSHSVTITGLSQNTTYYYQVRSTDSAGNTATDNNSGNYYTCITQADTTAPTISNVTTALIRDTGATITWDTNELATSQIAYGTDTNYGSQTTEDTTLTYQHSVTLSGLTKETTYYYKVISKDAADNSAEDDNSGTGYTFTTTKEPGKMIYLGGGGGGFRDTIPPSLSKIEVSEVSENSAKISWVTNEVASSLVKHGKTQKYENLAVGNPEEKVLEHKVLLSKLESGTTYHFQVVSIDGSGNLAKSKDQTFTTSGIAEIPAEKPSEEKITPEEKGIIKRIKTSSLAFITQIFKTIPKNPYFSEIPEKTLLSSVSEMAQKVISPPLIAGEYPQVEVGSDWAKIYWLTDKKSNSLVAYAKAEEYDTIKAEPYAHIDGNTDEQVTTHVVQLTNLEPSTTYHYQVRSKAKLGDWSKSEDKTFTTLSLLPKISELQFTSITEKEATLSWKTTVPTKSIIEITNTETGEKSLQEDKSYLKEHVFVLKNLSVSTNYTLQITAQDEKGAKSTSSILPFSTTLSKNPPIISNLRISTSLIPGRTEKVQTIVSWKTDKPATSRLFYEQGISTQQTLAKSTPLKKKLTLDHLVITIAFKPGAIYRLRAESIDAFQNKAYSKDYTILTPKPKESLLELIISNFEETFGFLKRVRF